MTTRKSLIAMVHIAKSRMGMDDETYRDWLAKNTGKRSSSDLSDKQLATLVQTLRTAGYLDEAPAAARVIAGKGANRPTDAQWKTARGSTNGVLPAAVRIVAPIVSLLAVMYASTFLVRDSRASAALATIASALAATPPFMFVLIRHPPRNTTESRTPSSRPHAPRSGPVYSEMPADVAGS